MANVIVRNDSGHTIRTTYRASLGHGARRDDLAINQPVLQLRQGLNKVSQQVWNAAQGPMTEHYLKSQKLVVVGIDGAQLTAGNGQDNTIPTADADDAGEG